MHTPTLLLVNILMTAALAICLGVVADRTRPDGLRYWALAMATHSVAYGLFGLRGQVDDWLSVVLANGLLATHLALIAAGLYQFQLRPIPRGWIWSPVLLMLVSFSQLLDNIHARIVLSSLVFSSQCVWIMWLVLSRRHKTPGRGQYFVVAGYVISISVLLARALAVGGGVTQILRITDSNLIQASTFLMATLSAMLISLGLVLMTKERADARNLSLALEDELTGLSNRRSILEQLTRHLAQAKRARRPLALLILDIDYFKRINDEHGHLSGDKVLRDVVDCLQSRLRAQDVLGRWGGEEFIAILPDTDETGAAALAEQLRVAVERMRFSAVDGQGIVLTLSIGVHALRTGHEDECDDMIGAADRALYRAKDKGRNRVERL